MKPYAKSADAKLSLMSPERGQRAKTRGSKVKSDTTESLPSIDGHEELLATGKES